jgi:hypothetical protein
VLYGSIVVFRIVADSDSESDSDDDEATREPFDIEAKINANKAAAAAVPDRFADDPRFHDPAAAQNALLAAIRSGTELRPVSTPDANDNVDDDRDDDDDDQNGGLLAQIRAGKSLKSIDNVQDDEEVEEQGVPFEMEDASIEFDSDDEDDDDAGLPFYDGVPLEGDEIANIAALSSSDSGDNDDVD